jgi:hypothetical protein
LRRIKQVIQVMEDMQGCSRWKGLVAQDSFCTLPRLCFSDPQGTVEQNL